MARDILLRRKLSGGLLPRSRQDVLYLLPWWAVFSQSEIPLCPSTDYISFLEKVRVLNEGFNDKAIEICKTVAFTTYTLDHPDENPENAFYVRMENDNLIFQLMINEEKAEFVKLPVAFYKKVEEKLRFNLLSKERFSMQKIDINWAFSDKVASFLSDIK